MMPPFNAKCDHVVHFWNPLVSPNAILLILLYTDRPFHWVTTFDVRETFLSPAQLLTI